MTNEKSKMDNGKWWLFALRSLLSHNALTAFINNSGGEMKWQTYQSVRNQMVHI